MLIDRLENKRNWESLTKYEKSVFTFFVENYDDLCSYNANEVAKKTLTSSTTINRTCKKLGYDGFQDLKILLKTEQNTLLKKETNTYKSINYILENINLQSINQQKDFFSKDKIYYLFGTGSSQLTAMYLHRQLTITNYRAVFINDHHLLKNITNGKVIIVSNSGETDQVVKFALRAKNNNNIIFSITKNNSSLDKISDYSITHTLKVDKEDRLGREQQIHMNIIVNELMNSIVKSA